MSRTFLSYVEAEYRRYRGLGQRALAAMDDDALNRAESGGNSVSVLVWHLSGNLESRFTDFLTTDGEKPWRDRDSEFEDRNVSRDELEEKWNRGWDTLTATLESLTDADLERTITIRGVPLRVDEALLRSLAHAGYHVGQIVLLAKSSRGARWESLSVPRGGSAAYNRNPTREKAGDHAASLGAAEPPAIETDRLRLRSLTRDDAPRLFEIARDPESIEDFQYAAKTVEDVLGWMEPGLRDPASILWAIEAEGKVIGLFETCARPEFTEREDGVYRIGYFIEREAQGQGYATEALQAIIRWLFDRADVRRIEAGVTLHNVASYRILEKAGFTREKVEHANWKWHDRVYDSAYYALERSPD